MPNIHRPNFYIFTGGPGVGKSTLLATLAQQNYACIPEVARSIIREQQINHGNALHTGDRVAYCNLMLKRSIADFIRAPEGTVHFFDRGIPDLHSYQSQYLHEVGSTLIQAIQQYRYNKLVFLFPPWPEIYCHDEERKLPFDEAVQTYYSVKNSYKKSGYQIVEVPKTAIKERVKFILGVIKMDRST